MGNFFVNEISISFFFKLCQDEKAKGFESLIFIWICTIQENNSKAFQTVLILVKRECMTDRSKSC